MPGVTPEQTATPFATIDEAIADFQAGKMVIIVDSEDRENEGDVTVAAEFITADQINFMATWARGLICQTMAPELCDRLGINLMVPQNHSQYETAFTVSIEAAHGVTTGISAADRAHTIRVAADPHSTPADLVQPGHIFPLRAKPKGVLERTGQTEGSVDLAKMAGLQPSAVICEIMNDNGEMARVPDLVEFCKRHGMKMISITDMIAWRRRNEQLVERAASTELPTQSGTFQAHGFTSQIDGSEHVALVVGDVVGKQDVLVRLHSECFTGDVFGSQRCDCGQQLEASMQAIQHHGAGALLYLAQEGRGTGLVNKLRSLQLQDGGLDSAAANQQLGFEADPREFDIAGQMLRDLGVASVRVMSNDPATVTALERAGVTVTGRVPVETNSTARDEAGSLLSGLVGSSNGAKQPVGSGH